MSLIYCIVAVLWSSPSIPHCGIEGLNRFVAPTFRTGTADSQDESSAAADDSLIWQYMLQNLRRGFLRGMR